MAGLTLQQYRDLTRLTLDLETEDLPDDLIDSWVQEGFDLAVDAETYWTFYQVTVPFTTGADVQTYPFANLSIENSYLRSVYAIRGERFDLIPIPQRNAEQAFSRQTQTTREPDFFSVWDDSIVLWPIPDDAYDLIAHGYRLPQDWITLGGAGAIPDAPTAFHRPILSWVLSRAYLQQDDPGTAGVLEQQFSNALRLVTSRYKKASYTGPWIMNQGEVPAGVPSRLWFDWE